MRFGFLIAASFALAACDSGTVPSPLERQQAGEVAVPDTVGDPVLVLLGNAIKIEARTFVFSADKSDVDAAIAAKLGSGKESGVNRECGAGPVQFVRYPGGLTANFMNDVFVGWNLEEASSLVTLGGEVQLGMARAQVANASGYLPIEGSTLGEEFAVGGSIGGFIKDDAVSMLYAGTQCFFR